VVLAAALAAAGTRAAPDRYTEVVRGRALTIAGDCIACHTVGGGVPYAGGVLLQTPFGSIATPNLTPDDATGLGLWTPAEFARAMHSGIGRSGRHLYPAFPYTYYTKLSRADTDAIYTYLRTLSPVRNKVSRDTLPFPFDIRALMVGWNAMFFRPGEFRPDPNRSAEYNQGAYLVEGLGHCGACHTAMNWAGANRPVRFLQGNLLGGWVDPNITDDRRVGLGTWSVDDIAEYLKTGRNAHSQAIGPMAEVVSDSTSQMSAGELHAIATYLKERGAAGPAAPAPLPASDARMQSGAALYVDNCSACHTRTGAGVPRLFPPLAGDQAVQQSNPTTLITIVLQGAQGAATETAPTAPAMPAFGWRLTDAQVADVLTYVRNSWGNAAGAVSTGEARRLRRAANAGQRGM